MNTESDAGTDADAGTAADTGARRATFLPFAAEVSEATTADDLVTPDLVSYDDDALATAMAEETERLGLTGAISILSPPTTQAVITPVPPPLARAIASGPGTPKVPVGKVTPMPEMTLSTLPAPHGQPVVFDTEDPLTIAEASHPTRRSLRDAEQSRNRELNARRYSAPSTVAVAPSVPSEPPAAAERTALAAEVTPSPDFSPPPGAPDSTGEFGGTSQGKTFASAATASIGSEVPVSRVPVWDLIEPLPFSAVPSVFPFRFAPPFREPEPSATTAASVDTDVSFRQNESVPPSGSIDIVVPHAAGSDSRGPAESEESNEEFLTPRSTTNPWLQSAAIKAIEVDPSRLPLFVPELSGIEPTPLERRVGHASRLFWLWFAANSSVVSLALGGAIFSLGMSLRQAVVAIFIGVAISFLPLGLGTLAGKWSGQPVMVVSRAAFGHLGNFLPATIALLSRLFWGAVLLWLIAAATARILFGAQLNGTLTELQLMVIVMAVGFLLALIVAYFGYALFARIQFVLGTLSAVLLMAFVVVTWPEVNLSTALTVGDGPVTLVVTGIVLVFSFVGLVWANSSGDLARYQQPSSSGGVSMLWASFGTTLPAFLLIGYGAVLAASSQTTAKGLGTSPLDTIAGLLPSWYPLPLIAATSLSLLSGVILSIYSGGFALAALGFRVSRSGATMIVGVLVFAVAIALGFTVINVITVFRDLASTLAVPVAAWAGIFAAEMIIRRRRFDTESLIARGGVYPDVNWLNLSMLLIASAIGFGFTSATVTGLGWEGYLFTAVGVPLASPLGSTNVGVLIALAIGLLTPLVAGVSTIRRQERGRVINV